MPIPNPFQLAAAVDLGSNSFHLLIGRIVESGAGCEIVPVETMKESVRLAAGLNSEGYVDAQAQSRAIQTLQRFGERLQAFSPDRVRVVATNTFRVAQNGPDLLRTAEAALGFPIDIISGQEEARLIYKGVAHGLPADGKKRLVIDIGGGSTEFVIGVNDEPQLLESIHLGCVGFSREFFPGGEITESAMNAAVTSARLKVCAIRDPFLASGWDQAIGSSGTAKAITQLMVSQGVSESGITAQGLGQLRDQLVRAGRVQDAGLKGLKDDRMPVFAGGVAIMSAIFDELGIDVMRYGKGALRLGVLVDLVGRMQQEAAHQRV